MIQQLINNVKGELAIKLVSLGLHESKAAGAVKLAVDTVENQLQGQVAGGNITGLMNLFNGKPPIDQSSFVKTMIADYGSKITIKLGLSDATAKAVSSFVIPFVMSRVSNKVAGCGEAGILQMVGKGNTLSKIKSLSNMFKFVF